MSNYKHSKQVLGVTLKLDKPCMLTWRPLPPLARMFNVLRTGRYTDPKTGQQDKGEMRERLLGEFTYGRTPSTSEATINKLVDRYWVWDTRLYTFPEEREFADAWMGFRQLLRGLGIRLGTLDERLKQVICLRESGFRRFFAGCLLIAEDRAQSHVIHACYQVLIDRALTALSYVLDDATPEQLQEMASNIADRHDNVDRRLFGLLLESGRDTVDKASAIIHMMLYMQREPGPWFKYLFEIEDAEIVSMIKLAIDALLVRIMGPDELPAESKHVR